MIQARQPAACLIVASVAATLVLAAMPQDLRAQATDETPSYGATSRSGRQLYDEACASCHGSDGRGMSVERVGFDVPLPDFTDCGFATREPDADWLAISHAGGPVRAFDEKMPAFGSALSREDLERILAHLRTFCSATWPSGDLNLPRAQLTEKAFPEDELLLMAAVALEGPAEVSGKLIYETRFGERSQFELVVPFAVAKRPAAESGDGWVEGAGDVAVGVKHVLFHAPATGTILSGASEILLPTGDEADGLGRGTFVFEPFLAAGQLFSFGFVQLQCGVELPFDTQRAGSEGFGRVAVGRSFNAGRFGRTLSPMFELAAKGDLDGSTPIDWDYVPQLQITLSRRQHIMANVGVRLPLTDLDTRPTELLVYLLWDWFDGGFLEGW